MKIYKKKLKLVGLKETLDTYYGGMKRRINGAVALIHDPKILIMDEPTILMASLKGINHVTEDEIGHFMAGVKQFI